MGDNVFQNIITVFIFFCITVTTISFIRYIIRVRKILKLYKDNPNIQGIAIIDGKIQVIEKKQTTTTEEVKPKEIILDPVCGKAVDRKNAYRVMREDKEYFFCSWECRENFLKAKNIKESDIQEGNV